MTIKYEELGWVQSTLGTPPQLKTVFEDKHKRSFSKVSYKPLKGRKYYPIIRVNHTQNTSHN
jgi:hypothetical protein